MTTPFVSQNPLLIFMDGSEFIILRNVDTIKNGILYAELALAPFEWTKRMLKIDDKEKR